jgi:ribosomal-protein-alanine N-acetyltransferase
MIVLPASLTHVPLLAAIHQAAFPPEETWDADAIGQQLVWPGTFALVEPTGGMLLGRIAADEAEILTLAVAPVARRRGIASALLRAGMAESSERGAAALFLEVSTGNAPARALYAAAGFAEVGRRTGYYSDGTDALVLRITPGSGRASATEC